MDFERIFKKRIIFYLHPPHHSVQEAQDEPFEHVHWSAENKENLSINYPDEDVILEIGTYLKYGFCKKLLLSECNSDQLPTSFHFVITFGWVQQQGNSKPTQK